MRIIGSVHLVLPRGHKENANSWQRNINQMVVCETAERAIHLTQERYGQVPIWSVHHISATDPGIILDEPA